jgi:hypothetical protein
MISHCTTRIVGALSIVFLLGACGGPQGGQASISPGTSDSGGKATGEPSQIVRAAPLPSQAACTQPVTEADLRVGTKVIVDATIAHGKAVSDSVGGSIIPLEGVKVLWGTVAKPPGALSVSSVPMSDADSLLDAGRYILLLGSSTDGVYYLAQGRAGAFPYADAGGNSVTRICTVYSADKVAKRPLRAPGSVPRKTLLDLAVRAASEPVLSPEPVPVPS